jgi:hypothetical protein
MGEVRNEVDQFEGEEVVMLTTIPIGNGNHLLIRGCHLGSSSQETHGVWDCLQWTYGEEEGHPTSRSGGTSRGRLNGRGKCRSTRRGEIPKQPKNPH